MEGWSRRMVVGCRGCDDGHQLAEYYAFTGRRNASDRPWMDSAHTALAARRMCDAPGRGRFQRVGAAGERQVSGAVRAICSGGRRGEMQAIGLDICYITRWLPAPGLRAIHSRALYCIRFAFRELLSLHQLIITSFLFECAISHSAS